MPYPHAVHRAALVVATLLCFVGCGGDDNSATPASPPASQTPGTSTSTNSAPTINGQPTTAIAVGESYFFQPTAADADGDALQFTAANLPRWASFDAATGRVVGTPGAGDVGSYPAIAIEVSDGKTRAALVAFEIVVAATGSGSATLSWQPPQENVDGSPLTDLAGYRIRYGQSPDVLDRSVEIVNPSLSRHVVENLSVGTWYFAIIVLKSGGAESALSNLASKTLS